MIKNKIIFIVMKDNLKRFLVRFPNLYLGIVGFGLSYRGWSGTRVTSEKSVMVLEGYPRSGNSFALKAFREAQGEYGYFLQIGNHTHSFPNILRGIDLSLPVIVPIRHPYEAILSTCSYITQSKGIPAGKVGKYLLKNYVREYCHFYSRVLTVASKVLVVDFQDIIFDFGSIISRVNVKFDKNFEIFDHSRESVDEIFRLSSAHLSPSKERDLVKSGLSPLLDSCKAWGGMRNAVYLYEELIAISKN